jgi:hypothetical protein
LKKNNAKYIFRSRYLLNLIFDCKQIKLIKLSVVVHSYNPGYSGGGDNLGKGGGKTERVRM